MSGTRTSVAPAVAVDMAFLSDLAGLC
jgi:hypothetical protein